MAVNIGQFNDPREFRYRYDQLNRITGMDAFNGLAGSSGTMVWGNNTPLNDYKERV